MQFKSAVTELEVKSIGPITVTDAEKGEVEAEVGTVNMVDREGDVILPGAVADGATIKISSYNHDSVFGESLPVGKGTIHVEGDTVVARAKYFMSTQRGREALLTIKELGEDSEWSVGFPRRVETAPMTPEWRAKGARRLIAKMEIIEASPVIRGAQIGTRTVSVKAQGETEDPEAEAVAEQAEPPAAVEAPVAGDTDEPAAPAPEEPIVGKSYTPIATLRVRADGSEHATHVLAAKNESLSGRLDAVRSAVWKKNDSEGLAWWPREVFDDVVIVQAGNRILSIPYTVVDDVVTLGEATEVEIVYRPVDGKAATATDSLAAEEFERLRRVTVVGAAAIARLEASDAVARAKKLAEDLATKRADWSAEEEAIAAEFDRFARNFGKFEAA